MAEISPLKKQFGARLRELILASSVRQCVLAEALQVSNSAISQMLIGKIIPRHSQLKVFCEVLKLSQDEELELSNMLLNIRNGVTNLRSRFNQMFAALRRERGLSLEELAERSGVPQERLQLFENCYDVQPLIGEVNRLVPELQCSAQDLLLAAGLGRPVPASDGSLMISEPEAEFRYSGVRKIPVIDLAVLRQYRRDRSLSVFGFERAIRQTTRGADLPVPAVAVTASARQLHLGIDGEVMMLVSDQLPAGYRRLELFADKHGAFRIRERKSAAWHVVQLSGPAHPETANYAVWSAHLLELIVCPVHAGMMK